MRCEGAEVSTRFRALNCEKLRQSWKKMPYVDVIIGHTEVPVVL